MKIFSSVVKGLARLLLLVVSLISGVLGAYGILAFITKTEAVTNYIERNPNAFFDFRIGTSTIGSSIVEYTSRSATSLVIPILLVVVGTVTWTTQASLKNRTMYQRIRFRHPGQASPVAWLMVFAATAASIFIIANWNSIDHTIGILVIAANIGSILWNLSLFR